MAKGTGLGELAVYGLLGYMVYYAGTQGYLGTEIQNFFAGIKAVVKEPQPEIPADSGSDCLFIPGKRYVYYDANRKEYIVVWGRQELYASASKKSAEDKYNYFCRLEAGAPGAWG